MEAKRVSSTAANTRIYDVGSGDFAARARAAAEVAKTHAAAVDAESRFPREAFAELRRQRLLGIMVPQALGGEGADIAEIADICYILGQACSSTALIYAMHQIKMACIVRHTEGRAALEDVLRRVATEQLLLASSTTEGQAGGNVRASEAADGARRRAGHPGTQGDGHLLRRRGRRHRDHGAARERCGRLGPGAAGAAEDDYTLERLQAWDTLGMRGTHSEGFTLRARAAGEQLMPSPTRGSTRRPWCRMRTPVGLGLGRHRRGRHRQGAGLRAPRAAPVERPDAARRRAFHPGGVLAAHAARRADLSLRSYQAAMSDEKALRALEFQSMITLTKVQVSELAVRHGARGAARLRPVRLSQRQRIQHRPAFAGHPVGAADDQQRPHPRQSRDDLGDDAAAHLDQWLSDDDLLCTLRYRIAPRPIRLAIWRPPVRPMGVDGVYARTALYVHVLGAARSLHHPAA